MNLVRLASTMNLVVKLVCESNEPVWLKFVLVILILIKNYI